MLHIFRVDIGETYRFETDLAFQDVRTLKSSIERDHGIAVSKQILIISGGELLDDDAVQVCMKTRDTGAGTEENPIYLLDKSHLERSRPIQISLISNSVPTIDDATVEQWIAMPPTYETIVQRAKTAQIFNDYAEKLVQNCERFVREQQAQYQGWMAVIANIEDTLSSFLLNRTSFDRLYKNYLSERSSYLELFQSLPKTIEILHQLKLPQQLISTMDNSHGISQRSTLSSSTSSISLAGTTTTSANYVSHQENENSSNNENISLFEWITTQLANTKVDDIINGCIHVIDECTEDLSSSMNMEIDDLSKKISNRELKHMTGIEERFAGLQIELNQAQQLQHQQKDCADYLISQKQRFSSNVGNQRDWALIKDISGIHSQNLSEICKRHRKLFEIEKKMRKSKQEIIDQLHQRFKNLMILQRHLVDYDAKQSLYIHKLNRTRKTLAFLRQLNQTPNYYYSFLYECFRRKQYSNIFNQFCEKIYDEVKHLHQDEISLREQFIKEHEHHFLFTLLPSLKVLPTFFIKEPLPLLDRNLPDLTQTDLDQLFNEFPQLKEKTNRLESFDPSSHLASLIRCTKTLIDADDSSRERTNTTTNDIEEKEIVKKSHTNEDEDDFVQCVIEPNDSSRLTLIEEKQKEKKNLLYQDFLLLKTQFEQTKTIQQDLIGDYQQKIVQLIEHLHQSNEKSQNQIEQLKSELVAHLQDQDALKIQYEISEQTKQELTLKCSNIENEFDQYRRTSEMEKSQILKALQSDFEFELEKMRSEHSETIQRLKDEQIHQRISTDDFQNQTEQISTSNQQTQDEIDVQNQFCQTESKYFVEQSIQTENEENDENLKRSIHKDQQVQFNLAIQRAVQNATNGQKRQILQLEQQLNDKRTKINKLKECIKKLQNFYTLSSTSPPTSSSTLNEIDGGSMEIPSVANSLITSSTDEEQTTKDEENPSTPDEITHRTRFFKRSDPISMPNNSNSVTDGNSTTNNKIEQSSTTASSNLLLDSCLKSSPNDSSTAVELYSPFAASPPNPNPMATSPQTPVPMSTILNSPSTLSSSPLTTTTAKSSRSSFHPSAQALPIAFFTVNRSDCVIIYYDSTYQHYMIYTCLPTLHFIHSDCYELFSIAQKPNSTQQQQTSVIEQIRSSQNLANTSSSIGSVGLTLGDHSSTLINTSMINSTLNPPNSQGFSPSTIPLFGQVTDKEYCQAKKPNNRFNVPMGTKFYRVRVKPWKPTSSSSTTTTN